MASNTFGKIFTITTFGESHGPSLGGIIDGCPAGLQVDFKDITTNLQRRRPGQSDITTQRNEDDDVQFLSGILDGITTGAPIGFIIHNKNQQSVDYQNLENAFRPSHADYTYQTKFGIRDHRGGGRSSARETTCRVVAGAIAKQILKKKNIQIQAFVSSVGSIKIELEDYIKEQSWLIDYSENKVKCPEASISQEMEKLISETKSKGDTVGGEISCVCFGVPAGIGEPIFDKLSANLAHAMMSIQATKGFEYGLGFKSTHKYGSQINDSFYTDEKGNVKTHSNNSGGIQGGISNGMPIYFTVGFKPVSTILQKQQTINAEGNSIELEPKGRHDACVVPRAVPIVEAMCALVLIDLLMLQQSHQL